jgi:two-component system chemotaxis response regulator CheY
VRILVADDAPVARAILTRMAVEAGFEVVAEAADAASALERFTADRPDLTIVDGRLPPDGGVAAIERLRQLDPAATIVIIAALGELELLRAASAAGAASGLLRPFVPSQVAALLRFARTE